MSSTSRPSKPDGPPYPSDVGFYQTEALSWLLHNSNKAALAGNRFGNTNAAIEAVKKLYEAGASRVDVIVMHCEEWRRVRDGGDYADTLEVTFPGKRRESVMTAIRSLDPFEGGSELTANPESRSIDDVTWSLWWD